MGKTWKKISLGFLIMTKVITYQTNFLKAIELSDLKNIPTDHLL